jgi:hypothetical protein
MKTALILLLTLLSVSAIKVQAQNDNSSVSIDELKLHLIELGGQEESAKLYAQQLDEALKPENIERSLAGVGSTRPEELREQRRKQLAAEKSAVTAQLDQLALKRSRLEAAISAAEVEAYHRSARGNSPVENYLGVTVGGPGWMLAIAVMAGIAVACLIGGTILLRRYLRTRSQI